MVKRTIILIFLSLLFFACQGAVQRGEIAERREDISLPADSEIADQGKFSVVDSAPSGTIPWENVEGGFWVLFSKPVMPIKKLEKPASTSKIMDISPPVEGIYRWYGSRLISFEPNVPLGPAVEYRVSIWPELVSLSGEKLSEEYSFSFKTEGLKLLNIEPSGYDVPPEECRIIQLIFNYPVELKTIRKYIRILANDRAYEFDIARPRDPGLKENEIQRRVALTCKRELPRNTDVSVHLLEGAKPGPENYGITDEQVIAFHTLKPLILENSEVYDWFTLVEAALIFNHPVLKEDVLANIRVDLDGYSLEDNFELSGRYLYLNNLPVEFESTFKVFIASGLRDIYNQRINSDKELELEVGPAESYVNFRARGDKLLESQFPPVVTVEFQNITSGSYTAGNLIYPFNKIPETPFISYNVESIPRNTRIFKHLDLSPYLNDRGKGSAYVRWNFMVPSWWSEKEAMSRKAGLRVQVTNLGFSSIFAHNKIIILASHLSTGEPLTDAQIILRGDRGRWKKGTTDETGLASFPLERGELNNFFKNRSKSLEVAISEGKDRLVFRPYEAPSYNWNFHGPFKAEDPKPLTYLCSDRGIYRPGEELSFYGIDRDLEGGKFKAHQGGFTVGLQQGWHSDNLLAKTSGELSDSGRFWGKINLPGDLEPDYYVLVYKRNEEPDKVIRDVPVKIAFFRKLNFEVDLSMAEKSGLMGDRLEALFSGKYLGGGRLIQGNWDYWWSRREIEYTPEQEYYRNYNFGVKPDGYYVDLSQTGGTLSGSSTVTAEQEVADCLPGKVYNYEVTATIQDIDRQAVSRGASALVFSSELLIGGKITLSADEEENLYFVGKQDPFTLNVCTVNPEGLSLAPGALQGKLIREEWELVRERGIGGVMDTHWKKKEIIENPFTLNLQKNRNNIYSGKHELKTEKIGSYSIEIRGQDKKGREALTRFSFYSTGSGYVLWRRFDENRIEIIPDKQSYSPGDRAKLLIKSPLEKGSYLFTLEREGILEEKIIELEGSTNLIEIDIKEEYLPVIYAALSSWTGRTAPPAAGPNMPDLGKPHGCFGIVDLAVDAGSRRIDLEIITSQKSFRPGGEAEVTIRASRQGKPLKGAEIAFIAADRGVLDLIDYHIPDPLSFFYNRANFRNYVSHYDTRELLLDPVVWKQKDMPGGDKEGEERDEGFSVRKDFQATAVFEPSLITGEDGTVSFRFTLPDQLTSFRATAVAVKSDFFGIAESEILVQNPINVRTALPRLLRVGDQADAGVVVTNLDDKARKINITCESNLLEIKGKNIKRITVKPGYSEEIFFDLRAPEKGTALLSFTIDSEILKEKIETELKIEQDYVKEAFTVIGQTTDSVQEGFIIPESFMGTPDEGLTVSLDSTIASSLIGAIEFLRFFPYDCLEQKTSKLFAYVLYDWLLDREEKEAIEQELGSIARYATEDGGFSYWADPGFKKANYYVSLRTAHLLLTARGRGHTITQSINMSLLPEYINRNYKNQNYYLKSYALYVLSLFGNKVGARADELLKNEDSLGLFEYIFLGLAYEQLGERSKAEKILNLLKNYMRVGTRSVTLINPADSWSYIGGNIQVKALLMMLYSRINPGSEIIQAIGDDLLASNRKGYWYNTSSTGWVLQAFSEYLDEERHADFTASLSLGNTELVSRKFKSSSTAPYTHKTEAAELLKIGRKEKQKNNLLPLTISKRGKGRLYYTATLSYSLDPQKTEARDEGIGLYTEIFDEHGKSAGNKLKLGEVYRMKVVFYSSRDRDYLALRIPIPSGAEVIDGSLAISRIRKEEGMTGWDRPVKRIYDNEVRFFYDYVHRGKKEISFLFRTTTPGEFPTPPAVAEMMYEEEVFGRTSGRNYRIVP